MKSFVNPTLYHGKYKSKNFFEGWYYKIVSKDMDHCFAIIPGISMGPTSKSNHSFIQILDGKEKLFYYCKFNSNTFAYCNNPFNINIDKNNFSRSSLSINIKNKDLSLLGNLEFDSLVSWKDSIINPGSMGFYNYLTFMECYSQVCAIDGNIRGYLLYNNEKIDFTGGKIYIEKNWGKSFPIEWLWIQNNTFEDNRATVTCSLGEIPFPIKNFRGFLIAVTIDNDFFKFTTINRSKFTLNLIDNSVELTVIHKNLVLYLKTESNNEDFILCYGPKNGEMSPYVKETLTGKVHMKLYKKDSNEVLYDGIGYNTGIEYGGNLMH